VLADAPAAANFTIVPQLIVLPILPPLQSLLWLLFRWCSQMPPPPQILHQYLRSWCSQKQWGEQSLHWLLCRKCSQKQ